jgi:hypothetical protein
MMISSTHPRIESSQAKQPAADTNPSADAPGRALVPLQPSTRAAERHAARPDASFVTHLIAMAEQAPQTRELRRETPAIAHRVYGRATARAMTSFGKLLSQSA